MNIEGKKSKHHLENLKTWAFNELLYLEKEGSVPKEMLKTILDSYSLLIDYVGQSSHSCVENDLPCIRDIFMDLFLKKPLTPIEDDEDVWEQHDDQHQNDIKIYKCKRYPSLWKQIKSDGSIDYLDKRRCICMDINDPECVWTGGIGAKIFYEMYPLTLPYTPPSIPIKIFIDRFFYHENDKTEYHDTIGVTHFQMPDGNLIEVHRYFKLSYHEGASKTHFQPEYVEITKTEYFTRKRKSMNNHRKPLSGNTSKSKLKNLTLVEDNKDKSFQEKKHKEDL